MTEGVIVSFPSATLKLMLVAVEPSADEIGAALIRELKTLAPGVVFCGCGGPAMAAEGLHSAFPIDALSVMGLTDAIRAVPAALKRASELTALANSENVDAVVFVDAWGFSRLCASSMRKASVRAKLFKLVAPQIWATRAGRLRQVKQLFDGVLCLLPFEPELFRKAGVEAEFVGNPNFQAAWKAQGDGSRFRHWHDIGDAPLLMVLPGSRRTEITRLTEPFEGAVRLLADRITKLRLVTLVPERLKVLAQRRMANWPIEPIFAHPDEKSDAFAAADAALAKSGTVTTELAINHTPMAVAYKMDPVSGFWLRAIATTKFVTILNVAAGREIVPEFLQGQCRPEYLAGALLPLLTDKEARLEQLEQFPSLLAYLGVAGEPAARLAAEKILGWLGWRAAA